MIRRIGDFLRNVPLHAGLLPFVYCLNYSVVNLFETEASTIAFVVIGFAAIGFLAVPPCRLIFDTWRKAGIAVTLTIFFLIYYPVFFGEVLLEPLRIISVALAAILFSWLLWRLHRTRNSLVNLTLTLNVVLLVLPVVDLRVAIEWYSTVAAQRPQAAEIFPDLPGLPGATASEQPDIWYIVPDRYTGPGILSDLVGFDNEPFLKRLEARGFAVAREAAANYQRTAMSVASTLNLDYLDSFVGRDDIDPADWVPIYRTLIDNRLARFLDQAGYREFRVGNHWEPTRTGPYVDESLNIHDMPEFGGRILRYSLLGELATLSRLGVVDSWYAHCRRLQRQLADMLTIASRPERKFVFAHLLLPHTPYTMNAAGECRNREDAYPDPVAKRYVDQVRVANAAFDRLFDAIIAGPRPAIIVLQADEGPWPPGLIYSRSKDRRRSETVEWASMSPEQTRIKTKIMLAIRYPDGKTPPLDPHATPVNIFRRVLSRYFGLDLPDLKDRSFIHRRDGALYDFIDVTDRIR
jgi:hypothetical protein